MTEVLEDRNAEADRASGGSLTLGYTPSIDEVDGYSAGREGRYEEKTLGR